MMKRIAFVMLVCAFFAGSAIADMTITVPRTSSVGPYGEPANRTSFDAAGEVFQVAPGEDNVLNSIEFYVDPSDGLRPIDFGLYIYQWDGLKITGSHLFKSSTLSATQPGSFQTFNVDVGGLVLTPGTPYVWFISPLEYYQGGVHLGSVGYNGSDVYANGHFVYQNVGTQDFSGEERQKGGHGKRNIGRQ